MTNKQVPFNLIEWSMLRRWRMSSKLLFISLFDNEIKSQEFFSFWIKNHSYKYEKLDN